MWMMRVSPHFSQRDRAISFSPSNMPPRRSQGLSGMAIIFLESSSSAMALLPLSLGNSALKSTQNCSIAPASALALMGRNSALGHWA